MNLIIDYGSKTDDIYEFYPKYKDITQPVISYDIGKHHYGVWVEDLSLKKCIYAAIWKIGEAMNIETQRRLTYLLDRLNKFHELAKTVIVERQMGTNINMIIQLEQHTLSYYELKHPEINVVRIQSSVKYRRMGNDMLGDKKHKRKEWAVNTALEICKERKDPVYNFLILLNNLKKDKERRLKCDDIGDAFIQLLAHYKKK